MNEQDYVYCAIVILYTLYFIVYRSFAKILIPMCTMSIEASKHLGTYFENIWSLNTFDVHTSSYLSWLNNTSLSFNV